MWTRRGFCYPSVNSYQGSCSGRKRRRVGLECDPFDALSDDLVIIILSKLGASAGSPSHLFHAFLVCKRFNELGADPLVLANASTASISVRAKSWSESAQHFLTRCANAGNVEACYFLGMIQFYCLRNYASGANLLARAALSNHSTALYSLAVIHFNGSGRPHCKRDPSTAASLCAKSAALGNLDALREVGYCLQDGLGLPCCPSAAHRLLVKANTLELITKKKKGGAYHKHRNCYCEFVHVETGRDLHEANRFMIEWWRVQNGSTVKIDQDLGLNLCSYMKCGRRETRRQEFRRCSVCGVMPYCSRACQAMHWKMEHRSRCTPPLDPVDQGPVGA